jgi:NlpC/P60 family putative phage cell wall peptidase
MNKRRQIVLEAKTWIGTPYHHKAKVKGTGVDCAMLVVGIAENLGYIEKGIEPPVYSNEWHLHNKEEKLLQTLEAYGCTQIENDEAQYGDILTFKYGRCSSHLAILLKDNYIIHARVDYKKVVQHELTGDSLKRWHKTYRFPGV